MLGGRRTSRPLSAFTTGYWTTSRLSRAPGAEGFGVTAATGPREAEEDEYDDKACALAPVFVVSPRPPEGFGNWTLNVLKESDDSTGCSPSAVRTEESGRNGKKVVSPLTSGGKRIYETLSLICAEKAVVERETYTHANTRPITFDGNKRLSLISRRVDAHDSSVRVHRHDDLRHRRDGHRRRRRRRRRR